MDRRELQLRRTRRATRGVVALGVAGALGVSGAVALTTLPASAGTDGGPARQDTGGAGSRSSTGGWSSPDGAVGPGNGGAPQGTSSGS